MTDLAEPELADVIALLRAYNSGDEETVEFVCGMVNQAKLGAMAVGVLVELLRDALLGGADELDEKLARWQGAR